MRPCVESDLELAGSGSGAALALALAVAGGAAAHGDPSTHALESDSLYPAVANRPSQPLELQLLGLLRAARRTRLPRQGRAHRLRGRPGGAPMLEPPQGYARYLAA